MTEEMARGSQLIVATLAYAQDWKSAILPGYAPPTFRAADSSGRVLSGLVAQRYPWRMAPYFNYEIRGFYDKKLYAEYAQLRGETSPSSFNNFDYFVSLSPALGMNTYFVGGDFEFPNALAYNTSQWGSFFIRKIDDAYNPANLLAFTSAHGVDPLRNNQPVDGFHRVLPPRWPNRPTWPTPYDPTVNPEVFGHVKPRWGGSGLTSGGIGGKAVVAYLGGNVGTETIDGLRDMRKWANQADSPDWVMQPRP